MMLFILAPLLLQLAVGFPTPASQPDSCTTIVPKSLLPLDNIEPNPPLSRGVSSGSYNLMIIHSNMNTTKPIRSLQLIEFEVPQSATTCQLSIADPACSLAFTDNDDYPIYSPVQLRVLSLNATTLSSKLSYNNVFAIKPPLVSSWEFGDVLMSAGDTKIFNSRACPAAVNGENGSLFYVMDYENSVEGFSELLMVQQNADVERGVELNGVYLTCC